MNDLFSDSFPRGEDDESSGDALPSTGNLDNFFEDVESIKVDLRDLESLCSNLQTSHRQIENLHTAKSIRDLRSTMDDDVSSSLKKARLIKVRLDALDRSNAAAGSSSDRIRISVVGGLRGKLHGTMDSFNGLRDRIAEEYRDTVRRRYYTVTGESAEEAVIDRLISTGESEVFFRKAIQEQGRVRVLETIMELQERHETAKEMERSLRELHQVFMDMSVVVQAQGELIDDIESHVARADSFVRDGAHQLEAARKHQNSARKWTVYGVIIFLVVVAIVLIIVLCVIRPWESNNSSSNNTAAL